jgi:F0F1-type ATP synthase epsilon subunit
MGILSNHVPSITQLRPGIVEVIVDGQSDDKWFGMHFHWGQVVDG